MPLLLDSADREEIQKALELEVIHGITTNPQLLYKAGKDPMSYIYELIQEVDVPVWIQVPEGDLEEMYNWCVAHWKLAPQRVVIKVPCTWTGMKLIKKIKSCKITSCVTTVFTAAQALVAFSAGADFVAPYVNRSTRKGFDGIELVKDIAKIISAENHGKSILAASLKTTDEVVKAYQAGATYITLPPPLLYQLLDSKLSMDALSDFRSMPGATL